MSIRPVGVIEGNRSWLCLEYLQGDESIAGERAANLACSKTHFFLSSVPMLLLLSITEMSCKAESSSMLKTIG